MKKKIIFLIPVLILILSIVVGCFIYFNKENKSDNNSNTVDTPTVELDNEEAKEMATEAFEKFVLGMSDGSVKYGESTTINKLNYIKVTSIRRNVCNKDYDIYRYEISYDFKCSDSSYCFVVGQEPDGQDSLTTKTGTAIVIYNLVNNKLEVKDFGSGWTCPPPLVTYE